MQRFEARVSKAAALLMMLAMGGCAGEAHDDAPACEDLQAQARNARIETFSLAVRTCELDTDCALVDSFIPCLADCGYEGVTAQSAVASVQARLQSIEENYCGRFESQACPPDVPPPPCTPVVPMPTAACQSGRCEFVYGD